MNPSDSVKRRVSVDLSQDLLDWLDELKSQLGHRSRGAILEHLLGELRQQDNEDDELSAQEESADPDSETTFSTVSLGLDDSTAIVLIRSERDAGQVQDHDLVGDSETRSAAEGLGGLLVPRSAAKRTTNSSEAANGGGIQLPGFVRRQARELRRSLEAPPRQVATGSLSLIKPLDLNDALVRSEQHWREVYGQPPSDPVLEAAMVWLARDVWPQSDHSDGRPFSWNLTQQVVTSFAPSWSEGEATLGRVITAAGILEDPFSGSTLALRVPTLITRFVQRHRSRQKRTMSFEAIDQSMTVHGALRLLQLPTVADRPYTLQEIREAYREQAQSHHPDAGGSADAMRRLNEAYQFLKERYRRTG